MNLNILQHLGSMKTIIINRPIVIIEINKMNKEEISKLTQWFAEKNYNQKQLGMNLAFEPQ